MLMDVWRYLLTLGLFFSPYFSSKNRSAIMVRSCIAGLAVLACAFEADAFFGAFFKGQSAPQVTR